MTYAEVLSVINGTLLVILLTVSILAVIKLCFLINKASKTMDEVNNIVFDVKTKVEKVNFVFNILDNALGTVTLVKDKIGNFFRKENKNEKE